MGLECMCERVDSGVIKIGSMLRVEEYNVVFDIEQAVFIYTLSHLFQSQRRSSMEVARQLLTNQSALDYGR